MLRVPVLLAWQLMQGSALLLVPAAVTPAGLCWPARPLPVFHRGENGASGRRPCTASSRGTEPPHHPRRQALPFLSIICIIKDCLRPLQSFHYRCLGQAPLRASVLGHVWLFFCLLARHTECPVWRSQVHPLLFKTVQSMAQVVFWSAQGRDAPGQQQDRACRTLPAALTSAFSSKTHRW